MQIKKGGASCAHKAVRCTFNIALTSVAVELPDRFSAEVLSISSWGTFNCRGLPLLTEVYQDVKLNSSYWSHHLSDDGPPKKEVLITVLAATADPSTPQANHLTRFSWNSDTTFENCSYSLLNDHQLSKFFDLPTPVLEKKEVMQGVMCEKWSNNAPCPHSSYWAAWYPVDAHPAHSAVIEAQYIGADHPAHSNPFPGCMLMYNFTKFSTGPIPPEQFEPPKNWLTKCINSDGGITTTGLPPRDDGYMCVSPGKNKTFSVALKTKPVKTVTIRLRPCRPQDSCVDGGKCKYLSQVTGLCLRWWTSCTLVMGMASLPSPLPTTM